MQRRQIVVVGGGTSGSIVAQSLANATDHEIVVIEPGVLSPHDDTSTFFDVLNDSSLQTLHEVLLTGDGPSVPYVQARAIGGGSAINGLLLTGEVPEYVLGLVAEAPEAAIGPIGSSLLSAGGRRSTLWWNNGRWNPGRALHHLVEEGRVRIVCDDVENIVFDNNIATGVETRSGSLEADVVVMCAGALLTPQILLRSGVGHHNQFVGRGLQDHPAITFALQRRHIDKSFFDTAVVKEGFTTRGEKFLIVGYERASGVEDEIALMTVMLLTPKSRGWVAMGEIGADINLNMLSHPDDVVAMCEAARSLMSLVSSAPFLHNFGEVYVDDDGGDLSTISHYTDDELARWVIHHLRPVSHVSSSSSRAILSTGALGGLSGVYVADASALQQVPPCTPAGHVTMEARRIAGEIGRVLR